MSDISQKAASSPGTNVLVCQTSIALMQSQACQVDCACDFVPPGELVWVRRNVRKHHESAAEKGVKLVHCCGYDSIPFDMGTLVVVDHMQNKLGK